jgi:hypothetical protein
VKVNCPFEKTRPLNTENMNPIKNIYCNNENVDI